MAAAAPAVAARRIDVEGPAYLPVGVVGDRAARSRDADAGPVREQAWPRSAHFLHPLTGGPDGERLGASARACTSPTSPGCWRRCPASTRSRDLVLTRDGTPAGDVVLARPRAGRLRRAAVPCDWEEAEMPLFPPVTDTLRWDDLVRQGRSQLPLVAPGWTDQNTSDPGIALLELLSWLVEADSFRSSAVTERERRLLLALAGFTATAPRPAACLLSVTRSGGAMNPPATIIRAGLVADGARAGRTVPLMLAGDIAVSGAAIAVVATAAPGAETDDYRSGCEDLTRARSAGQLLAPFGADPAPGAALLIGLQPDTAATPPGLSGTLDLWAVAAAGLASPEVSTAGSHHSARTTWETWDGVTWTALPAASVDDDTAALTRTGRIRLRLPGALPGELPAVPVATVGDQSAGVLAGLSRAWLRCRLTAGQHDAAPSLSGVYADAGLALAAQPYSTSLEIPAGTPVTGAPDPGTPLPHAVISLVLSSSGTVTALGFAPAPAVAPATLASPATALPAIDVVHWLPPTADAPGRLAADLAVLGIATGIPGESFTLPGPWCGAPPVLWLTEPGGTALSIPLVMDLVVAGPDDLAASLDPDGVTVRFGDGRAGRTLVPGTTVLAAGHTSPASGLTDLHPPLPIRIRADARTATLLGTATPDFELRLIDGLASGQPGEDVSQLAARAERSLWVHDLITSAVRQADGDQPGRPSAGLGAALRVPERAVTGRGLRAARAGHPGHVAVAGPRPGRGRSAAAGAAGRRLRHRRRGSRPSPWHVRSRGQLAGAGPRRAGRRPGPSAPASSSPARTTCGSVSGGPDPAARGGPGGHCERREGRRSAPSCTRSPAGPRGAAGRSAVRCTAARCSNCWTQLPASTTSTGWCWRWSPARPAAATSRSAAPSWSWPDRFG